MSTTTRTSRGKPVTLAKSASGEPVPAQTAKAAKATKPATKTSEPLKSAEQAKADKSKAMAAKPAAKASARPEPAVLNGTDAAADFAFQAKWNELVKAQSEAALAWWQDAKDAKTFADALAVNTRHTRLQFELAAGQAREMAELVQKSIEGNAERLRSFLTPLPPGR